MIFHVDIITLCPEAFPGSLKSSVIGKALEKKIWSMSIINLHDFSQKKNNRVDDKPYGGGPGMVIRPDVISGAIDYLLKKRPKNTTIVYMSARGKLLKQNMVKQFSLLENIIILCGRFEGIDQRIIDVYSIKEISIGDYILAGGESAAVVFLESCIRLLPGVLGNFNSIEKESFSAHDMLEYSQYTKPYEWNNIKVPDVLLSGNHKLVKVWRMKNSVKITKENRPELCEE
ncbi:MAG: tRNA (guanosine(37)-N1)-methyltransferase TrmD [Rickettsiaceae bacterium H1]|nr:tRNA (guanosine(37)-N1)-methyltransferase TrmD [Rickettsiaceae bacterium H1]